jgi:hypothetical protein
MRVFHSRTLLAVVEGAEDYLHIAGRLAQEISGDVEAGLKELPREITRRFNTSEATPQQTIDYASDPIIYMPDEFKFHLDVESLDRLARELLIWILPLDIAVWEAKCKPVAELWIGGDGEVLTREEREILNKGMKEVWTLPVRGKVFVLGNDINERWRRAGIADSVRRAGGVVQNDVTPLCDYFVTNDSKLAESARKAGAKRVIDTIVQQVLLGTRDQRTGPSKGKQENN